MNSDQVRDEDDERGEQMAKPPTFMSRLAKENVLLLLPLIVAPIQSLQSSSSSVPNQAWSRGWSHENCQRQIWKIHMKDQLQYSHPLFSNSNEIETGEKFDEHATELLDASGADSASLDEIGTEKTGADSPHFVQGETAVGIGGNDGFVYDVNALKRNLVQESVRGCKQELLVLLGDGRKVREDGKQRVIVPPRWRRDRDDLIEERLSALVQANPVSTTTDSNLLDGKWSFAFETNSASTILDTSRFVLSKTKRFHPSEAKNISRKRGWHSRAGRTNNPFRSSTREICLENLSGDENAHVIDRHRVLGGVFQTSQRYDVFGLTRTAIDLDMTESESMAFGIRIGGKSRSDFEGTAQGQPLEIQVLYLDTDLCICTAGSRQSGLDGPLHVYTKNDLWVADSTKRKLRLFAKTASWVLTMQSPLRIRQRLSEFAKKGDRGRMKTNPGLKAVAIGEFDLNEDGTTRESRAWDGPDDPFAHLAPGERMEVLRTMSLRDIYQSALERKEQNKKRQWFRKPGKQFKRPDC